MSLGEYAGITSKNTTGRPVKIYIERLTEYPKATVWPIPDNNNYTLVYYRIRRIEDSVNGSITQYDAPTDFFPQSCLDWHTTFSLSLSLSKEPKCCGPNTASQRLYEEDFALAATEDRDRSDFKLYQPYKET